MTNYDQLLEEARTKAEAFLRSTANEYIPKIYWTLRNEDLNFTPQDARDRIEKDCINIWSKRTILDALPDEAKDLEKQKDDRLIQKEDVCAVNSIRSNNAKETAIPHVKPKSTPTNNYLPEGIKQLDIKKFQTIQ